MLNITDLKTGTKFILNNDPYIVVSYAQTKIGRGGSIVKTKIKNLKTGATVDKTFQGADKVDEAELNRKSATFLYSDDSSANFMDSESFDQFVISLNQIGEQKKFLKENSPVDILYFQEKPINIDLPIKLNFAVVEAPPGVKGNSAGAITKKAKIETGAEISVPLFIKEGDIIVVDTRDASYVERV